MRTTTTLTLVLCLLISVTGFAQSFEGSITYKLEAMNPNTKLIPPERWKEEIIKIFGTEGYGTQQYYYKNTNYTSKTAGGNNAGTQTYNPADGLLYSWSNSADTAYTVDTHKSLDELVEITHLEGTETIMDVKCQSVLVQSKFVKMTLWYNPDHLKMDASLFEGHVYGHWHAILKELGCLPLKMEQKGFMVHMVQTCINYKEGPVDDAKFAMPEFKAVLANPIN